VQKLVSQTVETPALAVPRALLEQLLQHARAEPSKEQCGLLLGWTTGSETHVATLDACANQATEPACRYAIDPRDYLLTERRGRRLGLDVVGVYHSHPENEPAPSRIDADLAWPNMAYLIIALRGRALNMAAWYWDQRAQRRGLSPMRLRVS
jgi:proteasome lid subunit RPN8/RPN11